MQAILSIEMSSKYHQLFPHSRSTASYHRNIRVASKYQCALICHEEKACVLANVGYLKAHEFSCEIMSKGSGISYMSIGNVEKWDIIGRCSQISNMTSS